MMFTVVTLIFYPLLFGLAFLVIALGVKYGIIWAVRALTDDDLAKVSRRFKQ
ncbi:hypothetical protein [Lacticaseibacillus jixiensis]|uniref:hypothetical protein n=1 Tax=Lacticaseibacillus jixiensis TaxID=3231926 RepID=UPI0036F2E79A